MERGEGHLVNAAHDPGLNKAGDRVKLLLWVANINLGCEMGDLAISFWFLREITHIKLVNGICNLRDFCSLN